MKRTSKWLLLTRLTTLATALAVTASLTLARTPSRSNRSIQSRFQIERPASLMFSTGNDRQQSIHDLMGVNVPNHEVLLGLSRENSAVSGILRKSKGQMDLSSILKDLETPRTAFEPRKSANSMFNDAKVESALGSIVVKLPTAQRTTASELASKISTRPNEVLRAQHPEVGAIAQRYDALSNQRALQSLAQGLKADVDFDNVPAAFTVRHYSNQIEAADTIKELVSAGVERALAWNPSNDSKLRSPLAEKGLGDLDANATTLLGRFGLRFKDEVERQRDLKLLQGYMENRLQGAFDRLGRPRTLETGIWGKFVEDAHSQAAVVHFDMDASGNATIKLNMPEFENLTGRIPLREIATELAKSGDNPEVKMLLPRQ